MKRVFGKNGLKIFKGESAMFNLMLRDDLVDLANSLTLTQEQQIQLAHYQDTWENRAVRDPSIAMILAQHPNLSEQAQKILLSHNLIVRRILANNPCISEYTQFQLLDYFEKTGGSEIRVIWGLARNPNTTPFIQQKLIQYASDEFDGYGVYKNLAKNPNLCPHVYDMIKDQIQPKILSVDVPDMIEELEIEDEIEASSVSEQLATDLSAEQQWQLFLSPNIKVYCQLAKHSKLLKEIQEQMLEQNNVLVMSYLADNPYIDDDIKDQVFKLRLDYL